MPWTLRVVLALMVLAAAGVLAWGFAEESDSAIAEAEGDDPALVVSTPILSARRVPEVLVAPQGARRLAERLDPLVAALPVDHCLVVADGDDQLYGSNSTTALAPASNQKVLTASAALDRMGADQTLRTIVRAEAPADGGRIVGDLLLEGGGDPLLQTESYQPTLRYPPAEWTPLAAVADAVVAAGVTAVDGTVVGSDGRYDAERVVASWPNRYLAQGQVGPISALSVNDGKEYPAIGPATDGAAISLDPPGYAARALRQLLEARGVTFGSPVGTVNFTAEIATVDSLPMSSIVAELLTTSDNNTAEMLLKELDVLAGGRGSTPGGATEVTASIEERFDTADLVVVDGSGLDRGNRVSCDDLVEVLVADGADGVIRNGLAVGAETGTLGDRFVGSPAAGNVRAKTGTLNDVTSLSGWVVSDGGVPLTFSILMNTGDRSVTDADLAAQERLVEAMMSYPDTIDPELLAPAEPVQPGAAGAVPDEDPGSG